MPSLCGVGFWGYESAAASLDFYVVLGVNSGSRDWVASPLQIEPSPQPSVCVLFSWCFWYCFSLHQLHITFWREWVLRLDHVPRSLCISRSGGPMLTRGYTFWAVLLALMNPLTQDFRFGSVLGRYKGWRRANWVKLVSIYKSSDICFLRTGYVCANWHYFVTSLASGALGSLLPLTYVNFYPSHYSLRVIIDSRSGLWKATFKFYTIWWSQLIP